MRISSHAGRAVVVAGELGKDQSRGSFFLALD